MSTNKTHLIVEKMLKLNMLEDLPHFSCTHYPDLSPEGYGQVGLEFSDFGPKHVTLRFIVRGNGDFELAGCPNQWSEYQFANIFFGKADITDKDPLSFVMSSMPQICETLSLYRSTVPHEDYSALLETWVNVCPELLDKPTEVHFTQPWWKFWK